MYSPIVYTAYGYKRTALYIMQCK